MDPKHQGKTMPFLDHLEELRWVVFRTLIGLFIGMIICFVFAQPILDALILPASRLDPPLDFQFLKVQGIFIVYMEIGFFGGLALTLPFIFFQIWQFVSPGLHKTERRYFLPLVFAVTALFMAGVAFAYWIILPFALSFFVGLAPKAIAANIAIDFYIGFAIRLMFLFGIVFEMPVVSFFLAKLGLITPVGMRRYRRHAIISIFLIAALLTPPDPITQIFLGIPLILLYEFSIYIVSLVDKRARRREARDAKLYRQEMQQPSSDDLESQDKTRA